MTIVHGGIKFYKGSPAGARAYLEADHSRADDYYLAEGSGVAVRYVALRNDASVTGRKDVVAAGAMDGATYERWVHGYDVDTGAAKGTISKAKNAIRFVEVVVNGPKSWSLAASLHPSISAAYDAAQSRAAEEIIGWLAEHSTTRVGPRGRQVQVPVERGFEAAVVRHYTSRTGDPHRHLHLQINAKVFAEGKWRALHTVGTRNSIEAINGIGHAAVMCDPEFRAALAACGYSLDESGEIEQLAPYVGRFSQRSSQIGRHLDRYEAEWRGDHPGQEPGPSLRRSWDRRAWADARPDKGEPVSGADLVDRWNDELHELGFRAPAADAGLSPTPIGAINRDVAADLILGRLGATRSSWNAADVRGEAEQLIASVGVVTERPARVELAEDITSRAVVSSRRLLDRSDAPENVRLLTSDRVVAVETELVERLTRRAAACGRVGGERVRSDGLDAQQRRVADAIVGDAQLLVVEGAAGAGKTTTLAAAHEHLAAVDRRLVVVTPTRKAARVAAEQVGSDATSAAWLIHQHGFRWGEDGYWSCEPVERHEISPLARLGPGDVLLVDEAGMLDQDTALALLTIADEARARVVLVGDRHQLPAVGRGGVLDLAARWAAPDACLELENVHRFSDPAYAELSLRMRTGERSAEVFDALVGRGQIVVHASEVERTAAVAEEDGLVIADTREQVSTLNAAIRERRVGGGERDGEPITSRGERIGLGDRVATRRNDRDLGIANRDTWTVAGIGDDGSLVVAGRAGQRVLPPSYVQEHVELAYATTVYGAQGDTVDRAHFVLGDSTGAASAYVAMTRGRHDNVAHLVAQDLDDARRQWIDVFSRDRADLGPGHAAALAADEVERFGPVAPRRSASLQTAMLGAGARRPEPRPTVAPQPGRGIGR